MKLYFSPGACSLAPHIALVEAGANFTLEKVDLRTKQYSGGDFLQVNPMGSVPVLELDNSQRLTETGIILQYIADQNPAAKLSPPFGGWERYRLMEWRNYVSTEIHKTFSILFNADRMVTLPEGNQQLKVAVVERLGKRFTHLAETLEKQPFLMGEQFTLADAYLFTCLRWSRLVKVDMQPWPALEGYMARVLERPATRKAMEAEGIKI